MTNVSIIIPHHNGKKLLLDCVDSIYKNINTQDFEIIVVDNMSNDHSADDVKAKFPSINLLKAESNLGYSGGCNFGARHAKGKYIIFLNNDTLHTKNWVEELVIFLENNPQVGAAQPKILNAVNRDTFDYAGGAGGFIDKYCFPFVRGRLFNSLEMDSNQYNNPKKIFWASGAAFIIRKHLLEELNYFDNIYFAYMEEIDLCWRLQSLGWSVWYVPSSLVYHYGKQTIKENSFKSHYFNHRNSWILFVKNSYSFEKGLLILKRYILDQMAALYSILTFDLNRLLAIFTSHLWLIYNFRTLINIRKNNALKDSAIGLIYENSIAVDYFVKGKKYFYQIFD
jgi:GT2 family glycosyltransferase